MIHSVTRVLIYYLGYHFFPHSTHTVPVDPPGLSVEQGRTAASLRTDRQGGVDRDQPEREDPEDVQEV
jgi:hypothetical protein